MDSKLFFRLSNRRAKCFGGHILKLLAALAAGAILIPGAYAGTIIFNTLGAPAIGNRGVSIASQFASFSAASDVVLNDVQLNLQGDNTDGHSFSVGLYSDSSTAPGALLAPIGTALDSVLPFSGIGVIDFSGLSISLAANTRYWVGLSTANASSVAWELVLIDPANSSYVGWQSEFYDDSGTVTADNGFVLQLAYGMQLSASPAVAPTVPEPSSILLGFVGLVGIVSLRRGRYYAV
jgi:PEP-CTERM motif